MKIETVIFETDKIFQNQQYNLSNSYSKIKILFKNVHVQLTTHSIYLFQILYRTTNL